MFSNPALNAAAAVSGAAVFCMLDSAQSLSCSFDDERETERKGSLYSCLAVF